MVDENELGAEGAGIEDVGVSGRRKAAAFLLSLDSDTSAALLSKMSERDIGIITEEMSRIGELTSKQIDEVWEDFENNMSADIISVEPMLRAILEKALGKQKADDMLNKINQQTRDLEPFRSLRQLDAKQLDQVLKGEHPQVIAIVLSHLDSDKAFSFLKDLPDDVRYDVIRRIALTEEMPTDLVRQIDDIMEVRAFSLAGQQTDSAGERRYNTVAQMLNVAEPSLSKNIMDKMMKEMPDEAVSIQALMFVFDDLIKVADRDMQKVLGEIDKNDLALSLKAASEDLQDKLLNNLSKRARDTIEEEIEVMGPRPLSEVEEAQKRILEHVRGMEERGEISIQRGNTEEMV